MAFQFQVFVLSFICSHLLCVKKCQGSYAQKTNVFRFDKIVTCGKMVIFQALGPPDSSILRLDSPFA